MIDDVLPPPLVDLLSGALGAEPADATPVGGGMINRAARVRVRDSDVFVKWNERAPPHFFAVEADGLNRLRDVGALRVPDVLTFEDNAEEGLAFLALEFIESIPPQNPERIARRFGEGLAALHQNVSPDGAFGLDTDNYIGTLPQRNSARTDWAEFYRDCRLLPQIAIAHGRGFLDEERERGLLRIVERLPVLLADLPPRPALLHGDLWNGNFVPSGDEPVVMDPAAYYGEREMEIAFIELFGGFPPGLVPAYQAAFPLDPGYARRRPLHQLYPLLVHLNHFGEGYGPDVDAICRRYSA